MLSQESSSPSMNYLKLSEDAKKIVLNMKKFKISHFNRNHLACENNDPNKQKEYHNIGNLVDDVVEPIKSTEVEEGSINTICLEEMDISKTQALSDMSFVGDEYTNMKRNNNFKSGEIHIRRSNTSHVDVKKKNTSNYQPFVDFSPLVILTPLNCDWLRMGRKKLKANCNKHRIVKQDKKREQTSEESNRSKRYLKRAEKRVISEDKCLDTTMRKKVKYNSVEKEIENELTVKDQGKEKLTRLSKQDFNAKVEKVVKSITNKTSAEIKNLNSNVKNLENQVEYWKQKATNLQKQLEDLQSTKETERKKTPVKTRSVGTQISIKETGISRVHTKISTAVNENKAQYKQISKVIPQPVNDYILEVKKLDSRRELEPSNLRLLAPKQMNEKIKLKRIEHEKKYRGIVANLYTSLKDLLPVFDEQKSYTKQPKKIILREAIKHIQQLHNEENRLIHIKELVQKKREKLMTTLNNTSILCAHSRIE